MDPSHPRLRQGTVGEQRRVGFQRTIVAVDAREQRLGHGQRGDRA